MRKSGSIGIKTNDRMWVHLNKEPADSGGVPIDAEGASPQSGCRYGRIHRWTDLELIESLGDDGELLR